jgi:putative Holliday junction resolvase
VAETVRALGVDPGERYLGVAVSDEMGLLARPLTTLRHAARVGDAARIVALAAEHGAQTIVVGYALNSDGEAGPQARHAERLAEALREQTHIEIVLHDESFSSQQAAEALRAGGKKRRARREQIHAAAAAALLQGFLDAHARETPPG